MDDQPDKEEQDRKEAMRELEAKLRSDLHEVQPGEITGMIADFIRRNPDWREILESETERDR